MTVFSSCSNTYKRREIIKLIEINIQGKIEALKSYAYPHNVIIKTLSVDSIIFQENILN